MAESTDKRSGSPFLLLTGYYAWIDNHKFLPKFMVKELKEIAAINHQATMSAIGTVELTYRRTLAIKETPDKTKEIQFVLAHLKERTKDAHGPNSAYADAVINFFELPNRFYVNACIYKKDMEDRLVGHIEEHLKETPNG